MISVLVTDYDRQMAPSAGCGRRGDLVFTHGDGRIRAAARVSYYPTNLWYNRNRSYFLGDSAVRLFVVRDASWRD